MVGWISAACPTQAALVAHLKFDDNLNDQTGNHNGTVVGAVTGSIPAFDVGKIGKAVSIDGADVAVDLANPGTIDLGVDFTLALWFNSTSGAAENVLFYKGNPTSFGAGAKQFDHTGGGVAGGGPGLFIYNEGGGAIGAGWASNGMPIVHDGTWHHAALVHSVTTIPHITLYVDGIPKVRSSPESYFGGDFVMTPDVVNAVARIGARATGIGATFNGLIDDFQFYNAHLDTNQVKFLFDNPGLVILPPATPAITLQPKTQTVSGGTNVTFNVLAEAATPISYQWQHLGTNLPGATNATLTLTKVTPSHEGTYQVVVSATGGSTTSDIVNLYVVGPNGEPKVGLNMYAGTTITGFVGRTHRIDYVDALGDTNNWQLLATIILPRSPYLYFDAQSASSPKRFYRAVLVP